MAMKPQSWSFCDGEGGLSRRQVLSGICFAASGLLSVKGFAQVSFGHPNEVDHVLVNVFLRGGADGLNMVIPDSDREYHDARPSLALKHSPHRLDDQFALHPSLAALMPRYESGDWLVCHAVGSMDQTRSHFEAMSAMERGVGSADERDVTGWVARFLQSRGAVSPLEAVAISHVTPDSFRGATQALTIPSLESYRLETDDPRWKDRLARLYADPHDDMAKAGAETLRALDRLQRVSTSASQGRAYPENELAQGLRQVAQLIRAGVGLRVACLDQGGWDTHIGQGLTTGWQPGLLKTLGDALAAFCDDLGEDIRRVTIVVQTEFGRRLAENSGLGTDHGRASTMWVLGGGVRGGRVLADWPGLGKSDLEGPGDLRVTTDYRAVLGEVLARRMGASDLGDVFPGWKPPKPLGIYA